MKRTKAIKTLLICLFALGLGAVLAAHTPAGTEIRNQASASYIDSAGQPQTTTSNEVVTVVQSVYNFEIKPDSIHEPGSSQGYTPGQAKSGLAGAPVYFHYTVTNTGNTTDTINLEVVNGGSDNFDFDLNNHVSIYLDANCNGQVDSGESVVSSVDLAADASACLVVEAVIPGSASDGQKGNLNIEGTSQGDGNITDTDNWAQALVTTAAVISATKSADPNGNVGPNDVITYTISGSNTGGSAAGAVTNVVNVDNAGKTGILVSDPIPAGATFVAGSASGSAGAGSNISVIYQVGGNSWTATEPAASDVTAVGLLIEGSGAFFPQGAQFTLSFQVQVDAGAAAGSSVENTANVKFDTNGDGDALDDGESVDTNTTSNTVATVAGVQNGPNGDPDADGNGFVNSYTDPNGNPWSYNETTGDPNDAETITSTVSGGDVIYFPFTLQNTGNAADTYTLAINIVDPNTNDSADPTTWACQVMAADGTTPISGAVGPIAAGSTFDYVVKCSIPAAYEETDNTNDAAHIEVTATSGNDSTVSNKVTGIVTDVQPGYGVDVDHNPGNNNGAAGDGNPPAVSVNPGDTVLFPFDIHNTGNNPDTYDLTAQLSPNGFPSTIYPDANCDGVMDDPAPNPVTSTDLMASGDTACFILSVEVPADQAPGSENVTITATSNANPSVSDNITTTINVNSVVSLDFTPDRNGTVTSPGTIVYTHTLTNNGNTSATVSFSVTGSTHSNWTYQISTNEGNSWSAPADASVNLGAGASQEIQVRVIVPDGEPIGAVDVATVTATAGSASASVTDTTTVVGGDLRLEKQVDKTQAAPGETLTYTVTASNIGTADLKQVIITDPLPSYTSFVSVSATTDISGGTVLYSTDGSSWSVNAPTSLSAGGAIYVAVDTNGDNTITDADLMPAGKKITITFKVTVQ